MSTQSRRLALVALAVALAALCVWLPPLLEGGWPGGRTATAGERYLYVADTYGYSQTADQSVVASPYDLRLAGNLAAFPYRLGDWRGQNVPSEGTDQLGFKVQKHLFREYRDGQGRSLWLRLLASSDWGLFYHGPFVCYRGNSWEVTPEGSFPLSVGQSPLNVRSFVGRQMDANHLVLYTYLWPSKYRDMAAGATLVEVVVPFASDEALARQQAGDFLNLMFAEGPGLGTEQAPRPKHPLNLKLGNQVALLGYDLEKTAFRRGETLTIALYWQALGRMAEDYTVFVHVLNPPGGDPAARVLAQRDAQPFDGLYPTSRWRVGEVIKEVYELEIPEVVAAGNREVEVGMYLLSTQRRLEVVDEAEQARGDSIVLLSVTIDQ